MLLHSKNDCFKDLVIDISKHTEVKFFGRVTITGNSAIGVDRMFFNFNDVTLEKPVEEIELYCPSCKEDVTKLKDIASYCSSCHNNFLLEELNIVTDSSGIYCKKCLSRSGVKKSNISPASECLKTFRI